MVQIVELFSFSVDGVDVFCYGVIGVESKFSCYFLNGFFGSFNFAEYAD